VGLQRRDDRGQLVQPSGAPPRLKVSRDGSGKLKVKGPEDLDPGDVHGTVEAAERPPQPDDPRSGPLRDVPPLGGV
jgi:hypothetical protein